MMRKGANGKPGKAAKVIPNTPAMSKPTPAGGAAALPKFGGVTMPAAAKPTPGGAGVKPAGVKPAPTLAKGTAPSAAKPTPTGPTALLPPGALAPKACTGPPTLTPISKTVQKHGDFGMTPKAQHANRLTFEPKPRVKNTKVNVPDATLRAEMQKAPPGTTTTFQVKAHYKTTTYAKPAPPAAAAMAPTLTPAVARARIRTWSDGTATHDFEVAKSPGGGIKYGHYKGHS